MAIYYLAVYSLITYLERESEKANMAKGKIFCLFKCFHKNMLEKNINLSMLPFLPPIPSSSL